MKDVSVHMKHWKRVRDIFLEVVIAVALVTGGIIYVATHPRGSLNWGRVALEGNTVVVFGFLISWFRQEWMRLVFWTALVVLLLGHTAIYVLILTRIHDFPLGFALVSVFATGVVLWLFPTTVVTKLSRGRIDVSLADDGSKRKIKAFVRVLGTLFLIGRRTDRETVVIAPRGRAGGWPSIREKALSRHSFLGGA